MLREKLLLSGWTLTADVMPEEDARPTSRGFSLPGAQELEAYADLLGGVDEPEADGTEKGGMPFCLPGMLPESIQGRAVLSRVIDFGRLAGMRAVLSVDHLCGCGRIELDGKALHCFGHGIPSVHIDLTDALRLGRKQTLSICFDDAQAAGVCGAVVLRATGTAHFEEIALLPDPLRGVLTADIRCRILRAGEYGVRFAGVPEAEDAASVWRETRFFQAQPGEVRLTLSMTMRAERFAAGSAYDAPAAKLMLYGYQGARDRCGVLLDADTRMTGYPGAAPDAYVPLTAEECTLPPDELLAYAKHLNVSALFLPVPASELLYRRASFEGIALLPYVPDGAAPPCYPCVSPVTRPDVQAFDPVSPAAACALLCGMLSAPLLPDAQASDRELLLDAAGRQVDMDAPGTALCMERLRALHIRLRAEAARQGQYKGALCAPGEWREPAVAQALELALRPLHLSVAPLRGAWWTQSVFSASLRAFIPRGMSSGLYSAEAALTDEEGHEIAFFHADMNRKDDVLGVIEGRLPDRACVLTLRTCLQRSGAAVETQELPVFVGERGPLEAAFI